MKLADLYPRLPMPLKEAILTLVGMRVDRRRYGSDFLHARKALEDGLRDGTWRASRESAVLAACGRDFGNPTSLADLPLQTKEDLRRRVATARAGGRLKGVTEWSTGGTTGSPIDVPVTPEEESLDAAILRWFIIETLMGIHGPHKTAFLTGKVLLPADQDRPPFRIRDLRGQRRYYSMFHLLPSNVGYYARDLDRFAPDVLVANPTPLARLSRFLDAEGWRPRVPPRGIWSMAEALLPADREVIERVFGCHVTNTYGMTEMAILAAECRHGTLHVCDAYGHTEAIPAPGGFELVGTSYVRTRVPVVRYRTGDLCDALAPTSCACGLSGLEIRNLTGRTVETIVLPDGRTLTASPLADVVRRVSGVVWSQFEIVEPGRWVLRYHTAEPRDEAVLADVRRELAKRTDQVRLEAAWDASPIPPGPKNRLVVFRPRGGA